MMQNTWSEQWYKYMMMLTLNHESISSQNFIASMAATIYMHSYTKQVSDQATFK